MYIKSNRLFVFLFAFLLLLSSCNEATPIQPEINQPETERPAPGNSNPEQPATDQTEPLETGKWEDVMPPLTHLSKVLGTTLDKQDRPVIAYSKTEGKNELGEDAVGTYVVRWDQDRLEIPLQTLGGNLEKLQVGLNYPGLLGIDRFNNPIFEMHERICGGGRPCEEALNLSNGTTPSGSHSETRAKTLPTLLKGTLL